MRPLAVVGNVNVDLILGPVAPWPQPGTEVMVAHDDLRVGGAAGNAALVWQAMGLPFQFAANVGADHYGNWLADAFPDHAPRWPVSPRRTTLSVGLTHPDGERTFFTTNGHLLDMTVPAVCATLDAATMGEGLLLLCGCFITDALSADYEALFDWADHYDVAIALDTGWPPQGWTQATRTETAMWLSRSRIALFNEIEATGFAGANTIEEAAKMISDGMPEGSLVVIKRGSEGAVVRDADGQLYRAIANPVEVIDTIGAGDIFNAAFLAAYARSQPLPICLQEGVNTASRAVSTWPRQMTRLDHAL
ncbi:carbohydrate kinase family protein [Pararhizobium antarcticum]|uniref:Carbohydrate kinase n=1 Tax=Pararhizobium antarcticum TaxID=1798805 RepID=A0A657LKK2_9HYPH|nr:carbohydrate kinase family protein [Pararhizobium antarcticum]OJF90075.1 carbohydrate kinase [Pararhizobium antarcticum]